MADNCDHSSDLTELWLAGQIVRAKSAKPEDRHEPNGFCRWCEEPIPAGLTFCPSEPGLDGCRDDWQRHMDAKRRAGVQ
jgi:hypothetical protein